MNAGILPVMRMRAMLAVALVAGALAVQAQDTARGRPGRFDYYVLSLSWSPQHCAGPGGGRDDYQCAGGRRFGFVVHGLWPQYDPRGWPESCAAGVPGPDRQTVDAMLPLMPSPGLIRHEWRKHGTCSGMSARDYFAKVKAAREAVKIPAEYEGPGSSITVTPAQIEQKFAAANPGMNGQSIGVVCEGNGRFLQEVRVCLDKNLKPRACGQDIRDCRSGSIIMQPVR